MMMHCGASPVTIHARLAYVTLNVRLERSVARLRVRLRRVSQDQYMLPAKIYLSIWVANAFLKRLPSELIGQALPLDWSGRLLEVKSSSLKLQRCPVRRSA